MIYLKSCFSLCIHQNPKQNSRQSIQPIHTNVHSKCYSVALIVMVLSLSFICLGAVSLAMPGMLMAKTAAIVLITFGSISALGLLGIKKINNCFKNIHTNQPNNQTQNTKTSSTSSSNQSLPQAPKQERRKSQIKVNDSTQSSSTINNQTDAIQETSHDLSSITAKNLNKVLYESVLMSVDYTPSENHFIVEEIIDGRYDARVILSGSKKDGQKSILCPFAIKGDSFIISTSYPDVDKEIEFNNFQELLNFFFKHQLKEILHIKVLLEFTKDNFTLVQYSNPNI